MIETEMTRTQVQKMERIFILEDEIKFAESCLQPSATGHIHTSINWMKHRLEQLKEQLELKEA
jgi:hypothetical protein|tara:strand:+ start:773 stop:961 length:189 start_codon:yes stop_codon:yes gene_type:complete